MLVLLLRADAGLGSRGAFFPALVLLLRADAGLAWALGATQQEGEGTRKKKDEGVGGPERQKQARPLFCSKFFTTVKKMLRWARMVFLG